MKKTILVLIALILLVGCTESNKKNKEYRVEDYVEIVDIETANTCQTEHCKESIKKVKLKDIKFSNLNESLTAPFLEKHKDLIEVNGKPFVLTDGEEKGFEFKNDFNVNIYKNILSIMETSEEFDGWSPRFSKLTQSLNIDLDNEKILTNKELIEIFDLNKEEVYIKLLEDSLNFLTEGSPELVKEIKGDTKTEFISIEKYKKNIPEYAKKLNQELSFGNIVKEDENGTEDIHVFSLYIKNNELHSYYGLAELLFVLGIETLNGNDLNFVSQSVKISK